jgi:hypothetical protein
MPPLPDPNFSRYGHGVSLLGGWLPVSIQVVTVVLLVVAIGWRSRRWRRMWLPVSAGTGVIVALAARGYMNSEGLASDPAPVRLWVWTAVFAASVAVAVAGFAGTRWWRRGLTIAAVPLTLLCALLALNNWVGYYPTVQRRGARPDAGKVVPVDIRTPAVASRIGASTSISRPCGSPAACHRACRW